MMLHDKGGRISSEPQARLCEKHLEESGTYTFLKKSFCL